MDNTENKKNDIHADEIPQPSMTTMANLSVPNLTPETFELIGYRLWDKFRMKLWTMISAFLGLIAIAGLLGIPAYIKNEVSNRILAEQKKIEDTFKTFENNSAELLLKASMTNHIFHIWRTDFATFADLQVEALSEINTIQNEKLRKKLTDVFKQFQDMRVSPTAYNNKLFEIYSALKPQVSKPRSFNFDWIQSFRKEAEKFKLTHFFEMVDMYPHIFSLHRTLEETDFLILKKYFKDENLKTKLYSEYENRVYPVYKKSLGNFEVDYLQRAQSGKFGWATLWDKATFEFLRHEEKSEESKATQK